MSKKKLLILPVIAVVVAIMGLNVWAVPGSQQNWVKVYAGSQDITDLFEITEMSGSGAFSTDDSTIENGFPGIKNKIKSYDSQLKPSDFNFFVAYQVTPAATLPAGPYKVVVQSELGSNEIYIMVHDAASGLAYTVGKGGKPTMTVNDFSPFWVFTATSKTSPQTGDFAPAYVAMIGVALLSCGAIFAVRAKKSSKVTK